MKIDKNNLTITRRNNMKLRTLKLKVNTKRSSNAERMKTENEWKLVIIGTEEETYKIRKYLQSLKSKIAKDILNNKQKDTTKYLMYGTKYYFKDNTELYYEKFDEFMHKLDDKYPDKIAYTRLDNYLKYDEEIYSSLYDIPIKRTLQKPEKI